MGKKYGVVVELVMKIIWGKMKLKNKNLRKTQNTKIPVFRFPKDPIQLDKWKRTIPKSDLEVNSDTVICEKHWPVGYK